MPRFERSPGSLVAHGIVVAKTEAEALERELERQPAWRWRRRRDLTQAATRVRLAEGAGLAALGGTPRRSYPRRTAP